MCKMKKRMIVLALVFSFLIVGLKAYAVPASPHEFFLKQPDGTLFLACLGGDEWKNWHEHDGYTILKNKQTGYWEYAILTVNGDLVPSGMRAGIDPPYGLQKHLRDTLNLLRIPSLLYQESADGKNLVGTVPLLVIVTKFRDQGLVGSSALDWRKRIFTSSKSVRDYFDEASYGKFNYSPAKETQGTKNDGVVVVKAKMKHPNTGGNTGEKNREITQKALEAANKFVNFARFDENGNGYLDVEELSLLIVCAGYEAAFAGAKTPNIWAHRWSLPGSGVRVDGVWVGGYSGGYCQIGEWHASTSAPEASLSTGYMATIGIIAHELGHLTGGLPDLYDTDGSSNGIGNWGLMGGGSWNSILRSGDSPSHPMGWSKYFLNWIKPTRVFNKSKTYPVKRIETFKTKSLYLLGTNPNGAQVGGEGEYFLVENRQRSGYDQALPGSGLLIWHIDESRSDNASEGHTKNTHRLVDLEEADGDDDLDEYNPYNRGDSGDPFPGSTKNRSFTKATYPHSKWYDGTSKPKVEVTKIPNSKKKMRTKLTVK